MNIDPERKKVLLRIVIAFIAIVAVVIVLAFFFRSDKNQYGYFIKIQNFDQKVKNVPSDTRDSLESYLYNVVVMNVTPDFDARKVGDAYIREGSERQELNNTNVYTGEFIIDIESIKQSYRAQYSYSTDETSRLTAGNPVVISCLPEDQLKYGPFECKDLVSGQSNKQDILMQYLPYQNFSFKIIPVEEDGHIHLEVALDIPEVDLRGPVESRSEVVANYKIQVAQWITSKGADPSDFEIIYNYTDTGELNTSDTHTHED